MPPPKDLTQPETAPPKRPANDQATVGENQKPVGVGKPAIAGYEILGELGRGGMGVVYRARQIALDRVVALKMILGGAHAGPNDLARFRSEAQAVASLRHPNIVQVYDVGEHDGRPYFSLEFMDGGSLHDRLDGTPQSVRGSARLIELLARAMETAHQHRIVHRDLKPGNILLAASEGQSPKSKGQSPAGSGTLDLGLWTFKISDFGLAKRLDSDINQTRTGAVIGTPSYMAPEQAAGSKAVGPAADIYALGAILYDLLTGRPPFCGENELDTLIQVATEDPVPPSRLQPKVPRDLETICLKCLQKQPAKRYPSAAALADDLACFLANRPIQARPTGGLERAYKWTRRRPAAAALIAVCLIGAAAGLAGMVGHNLQLREILQETEAARGEAVKNAAEAKAQKEKADLQSQRAQANFHRARAAVDRMLTRVAQEELAYIPQLETVREAILADAMHYYEEFLKEKADDPGVREEAGRAYQRIGDIDFLLNKHQAARAAFGQALALQQQLAADFPDAPIYSRELAKTYHHRGNLAAALGEADKAEADFAKARALRAKLVQDFPDAAAYQLELAGLCNSQGALLQNNGRMDDARLAFSEARDLCEKLVKYNKYEPGYRQQLAVSFNNLGLLHRERSEAGKARLAYRRAVALYEGLHKDHPAVPEYRLDLARSHMNLGILERPTAKPMKPDEQRRAEESDRHFTAAIQLAAKLAEDFPKVPKYRQQLAAAYLNQGFLFRRTGKTEGANDGCFKALEIRQKLMIDYPGVPAYRQQFARSMTNVASLLRDSNNPEEARKLFDQSVKIGRDLVESYPKVPDYRSDLGYALGQQATLYRQGDQLPEARRTGEEAIEMQRSAFALNPESPTYRRMLRSHYGDLADTLVRMNDLIGAADAAEKIPVVAPKAMDAYFRSARLLCRCANHAREAKQPRAARNYADRAMAVLQKAKSQGLKDPDALRRENFKLLQKREDYQKLLAELEEKQRKGKK